MQKTYRKIDFSPGGTIETAIKELKSYKEKDELVYGIFNGHHLHSDIDDLDSAYRRITGKSKSKFDADRKKESDEYIRQEQEHKNAIPALTQEWIDKGKTILDEKYWKLWTKCVPIRLDDLYHGMELGACLEIITELNKGCDIKLAKKIIDDQGHSGMSYSLVCSMVKSFCDRGEEFVKFVR